MVSPITREHGSAYAQKKDAQIYNGEEFMPCHNEHEWGVETKINLKPFLLEGENIISLRNLENNHSEFVELIINTAEYCLQSLAGEELSSLFVNNGNSEV